jgi:hypothetical protein
VAALCEKVEVLAAMADCLADKLFTAFVALGRVDDIQAGIERAVQQAGDRLCGSVFVAYFRASEAKHGNLHIRLAKLPFFHP